MPRRRDVEWKEGNEMLQGRKRKGLCAVVLALALCLGPAPAATAQAEPAPPGERGQFTVEYTVNGTRWPDWTFTTQVETAAQALAAAPDHLQELGTGYERLPQPQAEGKTVIVAYRTKICLASTLVVQAGYYDEAGNLAGTAVQEYAAPAGERAVIDYLEGTWEGEEYIPVSLTLQATPFADSDSTSEAQLALTDSLCCGEGVHYVLLARLERRATGQAARLLCENEALQAMVSGAAQAGPKPAAHSLRVAAGGALCA